METLRMFDDLTMTPEIFLRYYNAGYAFDGRPLTMPGAPATKILEEVKPQPQKSVVRSTVRIAKQLDNKSNKASSSADAIYGGEDRDSAVAGAV